MKFIKFASIDVGSNAVRLLFTNVFETETGPVFRKLSLVRVPIRLGEDAFVQGKIGPVKSDQLIKTMRSFKHLMNVQDIMAYKAYATSAMREATNSPEIIKSIKEYADLDLEIVSGDIEAETLSSETIPDPLPNFKNAVFVDVGGGSTEMTYLKDGHKHSSVSFKIGTIRLLHNTVKEKLWEEFDHWFTINKLNKKAVPLIGTGGNINKLLKVLRKKSTDYYIATSDLIDFSKELKSIDYDERIVRYILNPDRADVIVPASDIFIRAAANMNAKRIYIPKVGLSDGIARTLYKEFKSSRV